MPHIHTKPGQHDHTASVFLFRTDFDEPKIVLHLHKKLGTYMQFGGHVELHETPWHAAVHELREEAGYDIDQLHILQPKERLQKLDGAILHPQPVVHNTHSIGDDHFHTDVSYVMTTNQEPRHQPDEGESTDIRLLTRKELTELEDDKVVSNVRNLALYIFDVCLKDWEHVSPSAFE